MGALREIFADKIDMGFGSHADVWLDEEFESFSWQPGRSRTGSTKAVGVGEHAGRVLYGPDADAALAGKETGTGGETGQPDLKALGQRVASGDTDAIAQIRGYTDRQIDELIGQTPGPGDAAAVTAAWTEASSKMPAGEAQELGGQLQAIAAADSPDKVDSAVRSMAGFLGRLAVGSAKLAFRAIRGFAKFAARQMGPYGVWLGSLAVGAAIVAAPPLAVAAGLIPFSAGLAAAVPATVGAVVAARAGNKVAGKVADRTWTHAEHGDWDSFAWDDWTARGENMVSPGGRVLKRETWERMRSKEGSAPQAAGPTAAPAAKPTVESVGAEVQAAMADPASLTREKVQELTAKLKQLPARDVQAIVKARGLDGTDKEARVRRIMDAVKARVFEPETPAEPKAATPLEDTPKEPEKPAAKPASASSPVIESVRSLQSGTHSIEAVRAIRPDLEKMSKAEVAGVLTELGYPAATKGASKKAMIDKLISNLEGIQESKQQVATIRDQPGGKA